jgi:hypothetical protein
MVWLFVGTAVLLATFGAEVPAQEVEPAAEDVGGDRALQRIEGVVGALNLSSGFVIVTTPDGDLVTLRATPEQVEALRPGERVDVAVVAAGDSLWIELGAPIEADGEDGNGEPMVRPGQDLFAAVSGTVASVDVDAGLITIVTPEGRTRTYLAHPQLLAAVRSGQRVSMRVRITGDQSWVTTLREAP